VNATPGCMATLKLLIVEDDIASLELMAEVFTSLDAEVRPLNDSQKAANVINQEKSDGIFLDLEMPNIHGFDLARQIRNCSWNKNTSIVIVTGRDDRETMKQAFALGATFFLQKPTDKHKLSTLFRIVRGGMLENRASRVFIEIAGAVVWAGEKRQGSSSPASAHKTNSRSGTS
jgi:DNA-binding response OmpR family regulator